MKLVCTALIAICLMATGCATVKMSEQNTTLVMAKEVDKEKGVKNISDAFTYEGNIYVYATFRWDDLGKPPGQQTVEVRWFNGDKLISTRQRNADFARTPYYVWFWTRGTNLGAGKCRVEVYANGIYVGSKSFSVVEKQETSDQNAK